MNKKNNTNVSTQPIISSNKSGQCTGVGGHISVSNSSGSVGGGAYKSGKSSSFWVSGEKKVGSSSSVGISTTVNNSGYRGMNISFSTRF